MTGSSISWLGLDERKEVALALVQVPGDDSAPDVEAQGLDDLPSEILSSSRVSENEVDYPIIREMHLAGTDMTTRANPMTEMIHELGVAPLTWNQFIQPPTWPEGLNHGEAVFQRRSRRNFVKTPISQKCMGALLASLCYSEPGDSARESTYDRSICTGFLVGQAEDMAPGFYLLDTVKKATGLISPGSFTETMAHICLDQAWLTNVALHFLFLTNLEVLDRTWGAEDIAMPCSLGAVWGRGSI